MKNPTLLIKDNSKIFTHCYSTSVIELLIQAKKSGKKFEVFCTETRPKLLGRHTAKALAQAKIPVTIVPDLAGPQVLKDCNLFLFGIEKVINDPKSKKPTHILNKIGSTNFIEIAIKHKIPHFAITRTNKTTTRPSLRKTTLSQLWKNPPKAVKVLNPAYEEIPYKLVNIFKVPTPGSDS